MPTPHRSYRVLKAVVQLHSERRGSCRGESLDRQEDLRGTEQRDFHIVAGARLLTLLTAAVPSFRTHPD